MNPIALITSFFSFLRGGGADTIIKLLQAAGILKDPEQEAEIRRQLAIERAQWVAMTTPPWERVALWGNTFVAVSRPAQAWLLLLSLVFFPSRLLEAVRTLHEAGSLGLAIIAIILWSFFGRSLEKGVELWFTALAVKWGGPEAVKLLPKLVPALPEPKPAFPPPERDLGAPEPSDRVSDLAEVREVTGRRVDDPDRGREIEFDSPADRLDR
jgi:hypothetical protein